MDNKIKTLHDYLQLSQAAFAKPLDLSPTHIARFEQGVSTPSQSIIDRICEKFGVDPRYFATSQPSQLSGTSGAEGVSDTSGVEGMPGAEGMPGTSGASGAEEEIPIEQAVKRVTKDEKNKEIGKRVREPREEKGWSQNELAKRSSVNQAN